MHPTGLEGSTDRLGGQSDVRAEAVRFTFITPEGLEELHQGLHAQLLMVLAGHLHTQPKVLSDAGRQQSVQTRQRIIYQQGAKEADEPLGSKEEFVHNYTQAQVSANNGQCPLSQT